MYKSNGKAYNTIFVVCVSSDTDDDCANDLAGDDDDGDVCVSAGGVYAVLPAAVCAASADGGVGVVVVYGFDDDYLQGSPLQPQPKSMQHSEPPPRISVLRPNVKTPKRRTIMTTTTTTTMQHLRRVATVAVAVVAASAAIA